MTDFLSNLFVSDAFAQTSEQASSGGSLTSFVPLILIFLVFYFLLIRPQQKKAKEHQATLSALKKGNKVFTNSGIYGVVASIDDKENLVHLEIAEGVVVKVQKHNVSEVVKPKEKASKSLGKAAIKKKSNKK